VNKHDKDDLKDFAAASGYSMFSEARYKKILLGGGMYPVTIDYTYTINFNGILDYPDWYMQLPYQSVQSATLVTEVPTGFKIYYQPVNFSIEPSIKQQGDKTIYTWTGSWDSWAGFGKVLGAMWKDKRKLNAQAVDEIKALVKNASTDREKVAILYNYLEHNFRYVSITIGMSGFIPFSADDVHAYKYGDCKALSNYMCAMLDAVGIKASPALINSGRNEHGIDTTFPSNKFDHAIVCAILSDGPMWLECTSDCMAAGHLGTFTENRYALLFDENEAKIVATPASNPLKNNTDIKSEVNISATLQANINTQVQVSGEYRLSAKNNFLSGTDVDRQGYIFNTLSFKSFLQPKFTVGYDTLSVISFGVTGNNEKGYEFKTGNKVFLGSTLIKTWHENIVADDSLPGNDIMLNFPYNKTERLVYHLPPSNKISMPADYYLDNSLYTFSRKCTQTDNNTIIIETSITCKKHVLAHKELPLANESLQNINKHLQQKLVFETN
jgi:hypothetical protein